MGYKFSLCRKKDVCMLCVYMYNEDNEEKEKYIMLASSTNKWDETVFKMTGLA